MLKNKIFAILTLVSLFIISFTSQDVSASSKKQPTSLVSMALVKDMMKPQFISINYQNHQRDVHRSAKLKEIQAEQKRMEQGKGNSSTNKGSFKLSFYDPAAMGSSMGYGGVAANLSIFPKGTRLKITLSDGTVWHKIVNDTGSFAASNPHQLDVAMPNNHVPSAGILYGTVEVIS